MKKTIKITLRILLIITIIFALVLFYALRFIDYTPYFQSKYYKETISLLNNTLTKTNEINSTFQAGFGKVNITPGISKDKENHVKGLFNAVPLAGFGDSGESATAVHDSLYIKTLALNL